MSENIAVIILAAGHGTRMQSATPKVLHKIGGLSMLGHVITLASQLDPARLCVVIGDHAPEVGAAATQLSREAQIFVQAPPQGTGDAVRQALPGLEGFEGTVLILYADTPLITLATLNTLIARIQEGADIAVLGFMPEEAGAYGRLLLAEDGSLDRIVEAKDATDDELEVGLCNSGVLALSSQCLFRDLPKIDNQNAKGEYYLTDIVGLSRSQGGMARVVHGSETEVLGVNSRIELAEAEMLFQDQKRNEMMTAGVTLLDPSTVYFSYDTKIGRDVTVGQGVVFAPDCIIADNVEIKAYSHLEGAHLAEGVTVGPFARLRPGTRLAAEAKIGNFVEVKKSDIGQGAKISHLSYIGDSIIGEEANIGAGTITCNYDGFNKHRTEIGRNAFIGSNTALVAPVKIGEGAIIGSGSVITKEVEKDALALARGRQIEKAGWAIRFRQKFE